MTSASLTMAGWSGFSLEKARARCWMRYVRPSFLRNMMNLPSSSVSQSASLVEVTPPSIITLSGR